MKRNKNLLHAKVAKQDEFYTQLKDIENELRHYRDQFKDKIVLCNCDDPYESNFVKYFIANFNALGLKQLIATCYDGSPIAGKLIKLFDVDETQPTNKTAYMIELNEVPRGGLRELNEILTNPKNKKVKLKGNGDFRSTECVALLQKCDIVVTNPPFSLFREFVDLLLTYNKDFLIIGNFNAVMCKNIFPKIMRNKIALGYTPTGLDFYIPDSCESYHKMVDGRKTCAVSSACWYTTLKVNIQCDPLILTQTYSPEKYKKYDNYDAINVDKVCDIPCDYDGVMGVPISFLTKYDPEQFEILCGYDVTSGIKLIKRYMNIHAYDPKTSEIRKDINPVNAEVCILNSIKPTNRVYYTADNVEGYLTTPYARLMIKRKTK